MFFFVCVRTVSWWLSARRRHCPLPSIVWRVGGCRTRWGCATMSNIHKPLNATATRPPADDSLRMWRAASPREAGTAWMTIGHLNATHTKLNTPHFAELIQTHTAHLAGRTRTHTHTQQLWEIYTLTQAFRPVFALRERCQSLVFTRLNINNLCDSDVKHLLKLCSSDP